jgi:hypothetical protein
MPSFRVITDFRHFPLITEPFHSPFLACFFRSLMPPPFQRHAMPPFRHFDATPFSPLLPPLPPPLDAYASPPWLADAITPFHAADACFSPLRLRRDTATPLMLSPFDIIIIERFSVTIFFRRRRYFAAIDAWLSPAAFDERFCCH